MGRNRICLEKEGRFLVGCLSFFCVNGRGIEKRSIFSDAGVRGELGEERRSAAYGQGRRWRSVSVFLCTILHQPGLRYLRQLYERETRSLELYRRGTSVSFALMIGAAVHFLLFILDEAVGNVFVRDCCSGVNVLAPVKWDLTAVRSICTSQLVNVFLYFRPINPFFCRLDLGAYYSLRVMMCPRP